MLLRDVLVDPLPTGVGQRLEGPDEFVVEPLDEDVDLFTGVWLEHRSPR